MNTIETERQLIEAALRKLNRYDTALDFQIKSLAGAMVTLDMATREISQLDTVTVLEETRYGSKLAPHPAFKIQRDAQDSVTKQMKALGLTAADLSGEVETDPLIDMTRGLIEAGKGKGVARPKRKKKTDD